MLKRSTKFAVIAPLVLLAGCASITEVQKGAAVGAAVGAVAGLGYEAARDGVDSLEAATVGALGGGLIGALVGDHLREDVKIAHREDELKSLSADHDKLKEQLRKCEADRAARNQEIADLKRKIAELERRIAALTDELNKCKGARVEYSLSNDVLFGSGSAVLTEKGQKALDEAAAKIKEMLGDKRVQVEGHTDTDPIKSSPWKSNWELGAGRALAVLHYLEDKHKIKSAALSASTYSMYKPVAGNTNAEGKAKNRRSIIVVYTNWPTN